jgi:hypothetical protein
MVVTLFSDNACSHVIMDGITTDGCKVIPQDVGFFSPILPTLWGDHS